MRQVICSILPLEEVGEFYVNELKSWQFITSFLFPCLFFDYLSNFVKERFLSLCGRLYFPRFSSLTLLTILLLIYY